MALARSGGCSCGAVRFQVHGEPVRVGLCHCTTCRKETGSVFMAFAIWPKDRFESTGETRSWENRHFCPACGSRLFDASDGDVEVEIKLGALDLAPTDLTPSYETWTKRREHWLGAVPGTGQHAENRPGTAPAPR
jgi:hypothetical protein